MYSCSHLVNLAPDASYSVPPSIAPSIADIHRVAAVTADIVTKALSRLPDCELILTLRAGVSDMRRLRVDHEWQRRQRIE